MKKKINRRPSIISSLWVICLIFGCIVNRLPAQELNETHNLIIVPFRGTPAMLVAKTGALSVIAPIIYMGMEKGSRKGRQQIVSILNENYGNWDPIYVIAQECSCLIEKFQAMEIENIEIVNTRIFNKSEELRKKEDDLGNFSAKERSINKWIAVGNKWLKNKDNKLLYQQISQNNNVDWVLEIFISVLSVYQNKTTISTPMKLTNIKTGKVITSIGSLKSQFSFETTFELENISDFDLYIKDFQIGAKQACKKILGKAGLLIDLD